VTAGITTRLIGAMIVTHADDYGLVMPLKIAPIQIAILTLFADKNNDVLLTCKDIKKRVGKYRNIIDCESESIGHKIMNYEIKGVPILIIVGPNDLLKKSCTIYRRDLREKITCELINLNTKLSSLMKEYEKNLFNRANNHLQNSIVTVYNIDDFKQAISNKKIVLAP
jgi:prolyl-tRNA synthetase